MSRRISFGASAYKDFNQWAILDKKTYQKIITLIEDINRLPF
ncbi:MAG: type II toxin-antitoxin system YoeB family toxin [Verrucomicrobia bacterium]|nr:type II toxin-antitoxin system YoeB family toxin [Leptolyngbya sp. ES-bin-22]